MEDPERHSIQLLGRNLVKIYPWINNGSQIKEGRWSTCREENKQKCAIFRRIHPCFHPGVLIKKMKTPNNKNNPMLLSRIPPSPRLLSTYKNISRGTPFSLSPSLYSSLTLTRNYVATTNQTRIPPNQQQHIANKPALPGVKQIVAVASGKGGVGKSTTAGNLSDQLSLFYCNYFLIIRMFPNPKR